MRLKQELLALADPGHLKIDKRVANVYSDNSLFLKCNTKNTKDKKGRNAQNNDLFSIDLCSNPNQCHNTSNICTVIVGFNSYKNVTLTLFPYI